MAKKLEFITYITCRNCGTVFGVTLREIQIQNEVDISLCHDCVNQGKVHPLPFTPYLILPKPLNLGSKGLA